MISIGFDIDITSEFMFERDDDLEIRIEKGKTLTVSKEFVPVACSITNDGGITVGASLPWHLQPHQQWHRDGQTAVRSVPACPPPTTTEFSL